MSYDIVVVYNIIMKPFWTNQAVIQYVTFAGTIVLDLNSFYQLFDILPNSERRGKARRFYPNEIY